MKTKQKTRHVYIVSHPRIQGGEPTIRGTRMPVRSIVQYVIRQGIPPETVAKEFRLTLAAIYDALSFYYDHRSLMDRIIERQVEAA